MKKDFLLWSLFLLIIQPAYSQLNYLKYGTSNFLGTYIDVGANGTPITTTNFDNANSAPQNIGFTFNYNGNPFTQFILNTNGFIKLGNTNPSIDNLFFTTGNGVIGGAFNSTDPADINLLCPFNHDLQAGINTPEYSVYTSGTAGSQVCTIQFKNVRDKTIAPIIQYDNMEFQIKLYETTNTIEFIYGKWNPSVNSSALKSAAVGLKGSDNTNLELLVINKISSQPWSSATFMSGNYLTSAFSFGSPPSRPTPDAGRTFRFVQALQNDAIVNLYTLGSIPKPYGTPRVDSAIVRNIGMNNLTNVVVTFNITGANTFTDTKTISTLVAGATITVGSAPYTPISLGTNNVSVSITSDDNNLNNVDNYTQIVNNTIFSYADGNRAMDGIGQNIPGYFATKYTIIGTTNVAGASIFITGNSTIGKTVYAILFDNASAKLDSSVALIITPADTGKYYNFLFPQTPTISNASFYVGLAQPTVAANYYPLGYQSEKNPVRLDAYFIRSMNTPFFSDLGGLNSNNPYRLMIQAVLTNFTGVLESVAENLVTAFPNPFNYTTTFKIQSDRLQNLSFNLYDITGKIVKTIKNITTPEFKLEKGNLQNGMYFYILKTPQSIIQSGKLIIE